MKLRIGIVGLPNVGKSTLFNALARASQAEVANYPFCTINPNVAIVDIPDDRLPKLGEAAKSARVVPAVIEIVDIAGLVKGAHAGEGLGNQFLSHIRDVAAILLLLRTFSDGEVVNLGQSPAEDRKTVERELVLADLAGLKKEQAAVARDPKAGDEGAKILAQAIARAAGELAAGQPLLTARLEDKEKFALKQFNLLTAKPLMIVLNVDEDEIGEDEETLKTKYLGQLPTGQKAVVVSAKIESEIAQLAKEEGEEFLRSLGLKESGLARIARAAYNLLGLQTFYTANEKEARAWPIGRGGTAYQAAGLIHSDFAKGFIAAEVISLTDFIARGGWAAGRAAGKVRTVGRDYCLQPDEVVLFRFNVAKA